MRIISCVEGETVHVGTDVRITILSIDGDDVVLEIDMPDDLTAREEPVAVEAM